MQAIRGIGDANGVWMDTHAGAFGSVTGAILQGLNVICCEMNSIQLAFGMQRLENEVNSRLEARAYTRLKIPSKYILVHEEDKDVPAERARLLPKPVLLDTKMSTDPEELKNLKRQCLPLKVITI